MSWPWLATAFGFALVDWHNVAVGKYKWRPLTKTLVILALLAGFTWVGGWQGEYFWFGIGLVFSMAGDVLLALPPRFFLPALSSFLLCHVFYLIGFSQGLTTPGWGVIFPLITLAAADFFIYRRLRRALLARPKSRWLRFPIHFYQIMISLMLFAAMLTLWRTDWPRLAAWLASGGALLFFISDTTLAFNRFAAPIRGGKLIVIISYHLGQIALIAGVLLRG